MIPRSPRFLFAAALLAGLSACHRQEVIVYTAPKDGPDASVDAPEPSQVDTNAPLPPKRAELPKITWKLPVGWSETGPGKMSLASFSIDVKGAKAAVSITPLPVMQGQEAETMIVNMWRQQAGEPELPPAEATAALTSIPISSGDGKFFEIKSDRDGKSGRIVTAMYNREPNTWFFKLQGDAEAVDAQKPAFLEFLKSLQFEEKALTAVTNPPPAPEEGEPVFEAPEGWRKLTAGQMQTAKFGVPDQGEAKAEVAVSVFPSDTGGPVANISRWRRQLGMPDVAEPEVRDLIKSIDDVEDGIYADLTQEKRRLIGAIVHRGDKWWFYKLMGDEPAVAAARDAFFNFVKTQPKS